jgi:CBS domain containing-hemolysin-like protein
MKNLTIYSVDEIDHLVCPDEFDDVTRESPASTILTDFKRHRPHVVEAHLSAVEAADQMLQENINLKLVVDGKGELIGLVSYEELSDQNILLTQVASGIARDEVLVADLMRSRNSIRAINYDDFERASVADIIDTLQKHGQQYYIVIDRNQHHIRGVVSSTEISRRLHSPIYVEHKSSVVEMVSAIRR